MNFPKPKPPVTATKNNEVAEENVVSLNPSEHIVNAMKEQLAEVAESNKKRERRERPKVKAPYIPKNRPLRDHPGLAALKSDLEKR